MSMFTIENHVHFAFISLNVAPSTALCIFILLLTYFYILQVRNSRAPNSQHHLQTRTQHLQHHRRGRFIHDEPLDAFGKPDDGGTRKRVPRESILNRLCARVLRKPKPQRPVQQPTQLRLPFSSLWLPFRDQLRTREFSVARQIQPTRLETRGRRPQARQLLE
jgi:hypothetical protein